MMTRRILFPALAGLLPWNWRKPKTPRFHLIIEPTGPPRKDMRANFQDGKIVEGEENVYHGRMCFATLDGADVIIQLYFGASGFHISFLHDASSCEFARWMNPDIDAEIARSQMPR